MKIIKRQFIYYIHSTPANINLGITIDYLSPNIEIHLPFCFIRFGWQGINTSIKYKTFGKQYTIKRVDYEEPEN